jgi:hypothetical protein
MTPQTSKRLGYLFVFLGLLCLYPLATHQIESQIKRILARSSTYLNGSQVKWTHLEWTLDGACLYNT